MTPSLIVLRVVLDRLSLLDRMLRQIQRLPMQDEAAFFADSRNVYTAESCLRSAPESLFDIGRHILSKGFGDPTSTYREVAQLLAEHGVLDGAEEEMLKLMAGYRNRLIHRYHAVSDAELFRICVDHLGDWATIRAAFQSWVRDNPHKIDRPLTAADDN